MCVCTRLSRAPWLETPQVSCGDGRHSSSGESGTSSLCVSSFGKADLGKPNRSPRCLRGTDVEEEKEEGWGGGDEGMRETDACLWDVCTLCINEPSLQLKVHPALQTIKGRDCPHGPLSPSHFEISVQPALALYYHGKAKQLAICKQNHVCLL